MRTLLRIFYAILALGFIGGLSGLGIIIYISYDLPEITGLSEYSPPIPSRVYSNDGQLLMELSKQKRDLVKIEEIPDRVINAFLAAEDDNFYNHSGVDYIGVMRAMIKNIQAGRVVQGASTITQQVVKQIWLTSERTYTRKLKEFILAQKIEKVFSKKEILFLYLNEVYLGGGYYGVKSAFKGYFDKELSEATNAEIALIAGLLVAPGRYSPYVSPEKAKMRQKYVLKRMFKTGKITKKEYDEALIENIKIQIRKPVPLKAGYFSDWVRQRLVEHFGKEDFITNGYEVVTTLDWELQDRAEKAVLEGVRDIDKRQGYKGPLRTLETEEQMREFLVKQRKDIYDEASNYLIFRTDGTTEKEFQLSENEFESLEQNRKDKYESYEIRSKSFLVIGNNEDRIVNFIDTSKFYEAVVLKVSNSQRMIYASMGGLRIVIPYDYFKWAHERKIQVERHYWSYLTRPESTFKRGDVILVKLTDKEVHLSRYLHKDFRDSYGKSKELMSAIGEQKFRLAKLEQEADAQGALVSISPKSGEILAMVGGADFSKSQFNRAVQSNRQPGSAFKPLIFAVGLENGYTPASTLLDSPQALGGVDDSLSWKPRNYDGKFKGSMTFRRALETSRNIPTIKLTQDVGVTKITNFVERLNLDIDIPQDLSLSLGSFGVNLLNMVKIYSIFPNGGQFTKLKSIISIKDRYGKVHHLNDSKQEPVEEANSEVSEVKTKIAPEIVEKPAETEEKPEEEKEVENPFLVNLDEKQVYDTRLAYLMTNLLKGVVQRGTGKHAASISNYIGGKTGTTNNYVDAWFLGFSSNVVTGVWTGFDNNDTLGFGETGSKSALPIWSDVMRLALQKYGDVDFPTPQGIVNVAIDSKTGKLYQDGPDRFIEAFVEGQEPGVSDGNDTDPEGEPGLSILDGEDYYNAQ